MWSAAQALIPVISLSQHSQDDGLDLQSLAAAGETRHIRIAVVNMIPYTDCRERERERGRQRERTTENENEST